MVIENINNNGNIESQGLGQDLELIDKMLFAKSLFDIPVAGRSTYLNNALAEQTNLAAPALNNTSSTVVNNFSTMDYLKMRKPAL